MKKLLILLSLTTAMTAFGAPHGNTEEAATMNVTATVIKPLTIVKTGDMDFGNIIQGTNTTTDSGYTITGEKGQPIIVTIDDSVLLSNEKAKTSLVVGIKTQLPKSLDTNGNANVSVQGFLNVPKEQHVGTYTGTLTARVQYQ
ncbi:DUF4402 domain-containing protein [Cetobacterium somerae]|uniref:DUF4402 domain-containing protein n=1 Tax=Cetobacterium somerae TaxID=188913 RepID=UPI00211E694F|nr:DUF4402 domain-containing protein [Cetobacterium somerae]MCQ9628454.1 DUF4402 domain-containing protein [Cetobacterium somerae]